MFNWIAKIAVAKSLSKGLKGGIATFAGTMGVLNQMGIHVTIDQALLASTLSTAILGFYEFVRNWLKSKGITQVP